MIEIHLRYHGGELKRDQPLCVTAGLPVERATHSVTVRLRKVLIDAGLAGRPGVTANSIRLTGALAVARERGPPRRGPIPGQRFAGSHRGDAALG